MNDNRGQRHRVVILATIGVLLILVALSWGFMSLREEQLAARPTTPGLVLQAFRDANYQINDLQVVEGKGDTESQFLHSYERFIQFYARGGSQSDFTFVRVLQYGNWEEAEKAAAAINRLTKQMNGHWYHPYRRGATLMAISASGRIASEFNNVFRTAAEP